MPDELRLAVGFLIAAGASLVCTPLAIAVATRTGFNDKPVGYKGHRAPTPYLGGAAVVAAFVLAGLTVSGELSRLSPIVAFTFALWCLGTIDDKRTLSPPVRLGVEFAVASGLWFFDLGWSVSGIPLVDLLITNVWVVGLANAFNLMDNMDGAAATVGGVTALATSALALVEGDVTLAILCAGMSGACFGFLPYNLAGPARIFLGDGGSLPVGFVVAATIMALPDANDGGWTRILAAAMLAGLPLLDTALVMISRRRAGIPLLTAGRDHLTHRLATRLGSPRAVALALGATQAVLGAVAIGAVQLGKGSVVSAWATWFVAATATVVLLETRTWAPVRDWVRDSAPPEARGRPSRRSPTTVEAGLIVFITASCGLSPALYGFYSPSVWAPIALVLLAGLLGLLIARPAAPRRTALVAVGGLVFVWLWSLLSTRWAESADQALTDANRWMLYATLFAILVLLLRDDRLGKLLMACAGAAVAAFGGYLVVRLLGSAGNEMFLSARLNEPLGYVNGQAGYLMLGIWPLIALAEGARNHLVSGAAIAGATVLGGLALLGQTRAIVPAAVISAIVLVAALPGRRQRSWALVAIGSGVGLAGGPLVDVYEGTRVGGLPDPDTVRTAILALLGAGALAGSVWALVRWGSARAAGSGGRARVARLSAGGLVALVLVGVGAGLAQGGHPVERVRDEWRAFKSPGTASTSESRSRFTTGSGNRYDYWRIAVNQFEAEPLKGVGAGNYDRAYFRERRTREDVRQPHSLPLQALAELGIVGFFGLLVFLGAVIAGFARRAAAARTSAADLSLAVAGGGVFLVWLVHTSGDWLHLIPGVTGIALCGAAVLVAPWVRGRAGDARPPLRIVVVAVCALAVFFGAAFVGRPALADRYRSEAQKLVSHDPRAAVRKAEDSLSLNDESLSAYYTEAAAYARLDDYPRARAALVAATRREPHDFVTWALLGDLAVRRGDRRQAARDYRHALRLNPREASLRGAVRAAD